MLLRQSELTAEQQDTRRTDATSCDRRLLPASDLALLKRDDVPSELTNVRSCFTSNQASEWQRFESYLYLKRHYLTTNADRREENNRS